MRGERAGVGGGGGAVPPEESVFFLLVAYGREAKHGIAINERVAKNDSYIKLYHFHSFLD